MIEPFSTTGIGSLPYTDPEEACRQVLRTFDIPFWPQLPKLSFRESMIPQYSEGLPCLKIDEKRETIWIEKNESQLTKFYEDYTEEMKLPVSDANAKGLHKFIDLSRGRRFQYVKGHVTGPLTFTLGMKDAAGRLVFFDEELREISLLVLKAKIRWQIEILKPLAERVIIFIDEPVLSALGTSSYIGVSPDESLRLLREASETIAQSGGISGIHCCSKADWALVIKSGIAIVSFDAYDYAGSISLYPSEFTEFLKNGGYLAWGIVPTTEAIHGEDTGSVKKRFDISVESLSKSIPRGLLLSQILLTPSCGAGSRTVEETDNIFRMLTELKKLLAKTYL